MLDRVQAYIDEHELLEAGQRVGVGLSGGLDSSVLLHVLVRAGYAVTGLHVNYGLRDASSDGDEAFARDLCERLGAGFRVARRNPKVEAERESASLQAVARRQRYAFFAEIAGRDDLPAVAVAHHRDDQAETVLLNLFRGSGPEGLAGMAPKRPLRPGSEALLVRPFLGIPKERLRSYAEEHDLRWRRDASNADTAYRRNALRHEVLPHVREHVGEAAPRKVAEAADLMRAYLETDWQPRLGEHFAACADAEHRQLDLEALRALSPVWQRRVMLEALHRWLPGVPRRASIAASIADLMDAQPGRRVPWPQGTVWRERDTLRFVTQQKDKQPTSGCLALGETLSLAIGQLRAEAVDDPPGDLAARDPNTVYLDRDRLSFPLRVRRWQDGDRLQPLGMDGSKTVSDLLTDANVPSSKRREALVVGSGKDIVWVVGHRLAEVARMHSSSRRYVKITFIPGEKL